MMYSEASSPGDMVPNNMLRKKDIVKSVAKKMNLDTLLVAEIIDAYHREMRIKLIAGNEIQIVGFGRYVMFMMRGRRYKIVTKNGTFTDTPPPTPRLKIILATKFKQDFIHEQSRNRKSRR